MVDNSGSDGREAELRRHLAEAHRQLLERDDLYQHHEEVVQRLRAELADVRRWATELERSILEMQETRAWRWAARVRAIKRSALRSIGQ